MNRYYFYLWDTEACPVTRGLPSAEAWHLATRLAWAEGSSAREALEKVREDFPGERYLLKVTPRELQEMDAGMIEVPVLDTLRGTRFLWKAAARTLGEAVELAAEQWPEPRYLIDVTDDEIEEADGYADCWEEEDLEEEEDGSWWAESWREDAAVEEALFRRLGCSL